MEHEIAHRPSEALLTVELGPGETIVAEAGALVSHAGDVHIETGARGGVFGSLKRALGGESFFVNTFRSESGGEVDLAPPLPGDIVHHELTGEELYVQSGSYLAATEGIEVDTKFGGARSFLGGEGMFLLRLTGDGETFLSSYGAVDRIQVDPGETLTVDTGHVVAFEGVDWDVSRVGGLKSTLFSGEGLISEFTGHNSAGTVWIQTRSPDAFVSWLAPKLPSRTVHTSSGGGTHGGSGGRGGGGGGGFNVKF